MDEATDGQWLLPASEALLVVEVVSASSRHDDYKTKRDACALSRIPLYLVIDPETSSLTLFSLPGEEGYRQVTPLPAGGRIDLPEPLGFTLDTAEMPMERQ
jgi:Uma2 family endonuclease